MLSKLKNLFAGLPDDTPSNTPGANHTPVQIAVAALMVRVAHADAEFTDCEKQVVLSVLQTRFDLPPAPAQALLDAATLAEAQASDAVSFTRTIKDHINIDDRDEVIEALWAVALADGTRDDQENAELRLMAKLLGVTDRASGMARQRVLTQNS